MKPEFKVSASLSVAALALLTGCGAPAQAHPDHQSRHWEANIDKAVISADFWANQDDPQVVKTSRYLATITDGSTTGLSYVYVRTDNTKGQNATVVASVKVTDQSNKQVELKEASSLINDSCYGSGKDAWYLDTDQDKKLFNDYCIDFQRELWGDHTGSLGGESTETLYVTPGPVDGSVKQVTFTTNTEGTGFKFAKANNK